MPKRQRTSKLHNLDFIGPLSASNILDWIITAWLVFTIGWTITHLGGTYEPTKPTITLMVGGLLLLHGLWLIVQKERPIKLNRLGLLFLPFFLLCLFNYHFVTPVKWLAKGEIITWSQAGAIFWVVIHNLRRKEQVWFLAAGLLVSALISLYWAFLQYFMEIHQSWLPMGRVQTEAHLGRAAGTFGNPNSFGALMVLVIPPLLTATFMGRFPAILRVLCFYTATLCLVGLAISLSRGAWIACWASLLVFSYFVSQLRWIRWAVFLGLLTLMLIGSLFIYTKSNSARERIDRILVEKGEYSRWGMWSASWKIFKENPVFGSGAASFPTKFEAHRTEDIRKTPKYAHNDYLNTLSDYGIVGFLLLFGPIFYLLFRAFRTWHQVPFEGKSRGKVRTVTPTSKMFLAATIVSLTGILLHICVDFDLKVPALLFFVATILGLLVKFTSTRRWQLPNNNVIPISYTSITLILAGLQSIEGFETFQATAEYNEGKERMNFMADHFNELKHDRQFLSDTIKHFEYAFSWQPNHAEALAEYAFNTLQFYHTDPDNYKQYGKHAEEKIDLALAECDEIWKFHAYKGLAQDMQGVPIEETQYFLKTAVHMAPNNATAWYYYAFIISSDPRWKFIAIDAIETAIRLDPFLKSAQHLRNKLRLP